MGIDRSAPDHTTLSRRSQHLDLTLRRVPPGEAMHLIVDSTGLSIVGEGEWAAAKHGRRGTRGWKTLHVGVDRSGAIVTQALTDAHADDAGTAITLIDAVDGDLASVTGDAAYDTVAFYAAAGARGANVVVPPIKTSAGISTGLAIGRSGSDDHEGEEARAATVEERIRLPSAGARREHVLPVQVDHRR